MCICGCLFTMKSWVIGKDSDAGRDWGQEEKGTTEDEMAGWHHWLDGHESEWTPGVGDGQEGLACYDSWGHKESGTTEWLNWTDSLSHVQLFCDSMNCSLLVSAVHGISQARILKLVAISSPRGSSQPRDQIWISCVSCTARGFFTTEPLGSPLLCL